MAVHDTSPRTIALTGATGYVGGKLLPALLEHGDEVRCLVRHPERARLPEPAKVVQGDVLKGEGLDALLEGADVAYYLVHSMGGSGGDDFVARDKQGAENFAHAARNAGVQRIVYLGGLEDGTMGSEHLKSRQEVAETLEKESGDGVHFVHARAAMVLGGGSASFIILRNLVKRLPVMLTPRWVQTRSQPVAIRDVVRALDALGHMEDPPAEAQLGGADVLTYAEMMKRFARLDDRRPPAIVPVPVLSPGLSSHWVSLFTPVDRGLVQPLVQGLSAEMLVTDPPPAGVNDEPLGFDEAVAEALAEEQDRG